MNEVVLHYFQGRGLGEQVRLMLWEAGVKYKERYIDTREKLEGLRQNNCLLFQVLSTVASTRNRWVEVGSVQCYCALHSEKI